VTRRETWMGKDKAKAFAAARQLNAILTQATDLVGRVTGMGKTVADAVKVFREDDVPGRKWGVRTAAEYAIIIRRIEASLGERPLEALTVKDCAEWLRTDTESERGRQTRRLVLGWILACAVEEGWMETNPALVTRKFSFTRKRERLTLETFQAIRAAGPQWLQVAMDLSLLTLLRRDDIVSLTFADVHDGGNVGGAKQDRGQHAGEAQDQPHPRAAGSAHARARSGGVALYRAPPAREGAAAAEARKGP